MRSSQEAADTMKTIEHFQSLHCSDLLSIEHLSGAEIEMLLATAARLKRDDASLQRAFSGRSMVMLFEKPSLRTRMSFEIGFAKLGGHPVYFDHQSAGGRIGQRESIEDTAKNLERFCDVIVARTFSHETIAALAKHAQVPVINALCDRFHPCQALADALTIAEKFPDRAFSDLTLCWIGDGNNVCHSLLHIASLLGMHMTVVTPKGYEPSADVVATARRLARENGSKITLSNDIDAAANADVVVTDTWVSMGSEAEAEQRARVFSPFQVTARVMRSAAPHAIFMHCLPAYRGKEVAAEVIDGPQSVVFDEAENRMHAQSALLLHLLADRAAIKEDDAAASTWPDAIGAD
jgi:ornithine carbamoyltransferase